MQMVRGKTYRYTGQRVPSFTDRILYKTRWALTFGPFLYFRSGPQKRRSNLPATARPASQPICCSRLTTHVLLSVLCCPRLLPSSSAAPPSPGAAHSIHKECFRPAPTIGTSDHKMVYGRFNIAVPRPFPSRPVPAAASSTAVCVIRLDDVKYTCLNTRCLCKRLLLKRSFAAFPQR